MASGSFTLDTDNSNISGKLYWSSTEDIEANTSSVKVDMKLSRTNSGYTTYGTGWFSFTVNGTERRVDGKDFTLTYNSNTVMISGTVTVPHNSDGSKTVTISWDGDSNVFNLYSGSGSAKMDTIPRASKLTGGWSWTAGDSTKFTIDRASSDFTHTIKVEMWSGSAWTTLQTITDVGTSYTWTPGTTDLTTIFNYLNNDTTNWNQETRITVTTFDGSKQVGSPYVRDGGTLSSPTASTVSSTVSFNVGSSVPITVTEKLAAFTYTLRFYIGSTLLHTKTGAGQSYTWVPTPTERDNAYKAMTTSKTAVSKVEVDTYYNANKVRSTTSKTGTATVTTGILSFSTIDYFDNNSTTAALTNPYKGANKPYIIQGQSDVHATILNANKAIAQNFATITKYIAVLNGVTKTVNAPFSTDIVFDFGTTTADKNQTLTITAYDSRGYTKVVTMTVNIVKWSKPVISATGKRTSGFLDETTLNVSGSYSPVNVNGTNINALDVNQSYYAWRVKGGTYGTNTLFSSINVTAPNYTTPATLVNGVTGLSSTSAWEILVTIKDKFASNTYLVPIGTGVPLLFWDSAKKVMGLGLFPSFVTAAGSLEMAGTLAFAPNRYDSLGGAMNLRNGDVLGSNSYYWNDACGSSEGFFFPKTSATDVLDKAQCDNVRALDGELLLNGNPVYNAKNMMIARGQLTMTTVTTNTIVAQSVSYGKTFPGNPTVTLTANSGSANVMDGIMLGSTGAGTTSFTLNVAKTNNGAIGINWVAVWEG
jgi:hypothetical protein